MQEIWRFITLLLNHQLQVETGDVYHCTRYSVYPIIFCRLHPSLYCTLILNVDSIYIIKQFDWQLVNVLKWSLGYTWQIVIFREYFGTNLYTVIKFWIYALGDSFGPRSPPLTKIIKGILERYPDGGQILKVITKLYIYIYITMVTITQICY